MQKILIGLALLAAMAPAVAQDRDGTDHPLVPRYPNSFIGSYRAASLDNIVLPVGSIANQEANTNKQKLEGRVTHIDYSLRPTVATLQIARYFQDVLQRQGFKEVYYCSGDSCGGDMASLILNSGKVAPVGLASSPFNETIRVLVARKANTWVLIHMAADLGGAAIYEAIVEDAKP